MTGNRSEDEQAIDALAAAFFRLFSNRDGARPDLTGIFELFVAEGSIAKCTASEPEIATLREFIEPRQKLLTDGTLTDFAEVETSASTSIFGNVAQRVSTYEKSGRREGVAFAQRGVKTLQFVRTARGWKIFSVAWDDEREGFTVPLLDAAEEFLKEAK